MPAHNHFFNATIDRGTTATSAGNQLGVGSTGDKQNSWNANIYSPNPTKATTGLSPLAIGITGLEPPAQQHAALPDAQLLHRDAGRLPAAWLISNFREGST